MKVIVYVFGIDLLGSSRASVWLMYAAGFTILVASLVALSKDNLKARLAYSTISQLSYVLLGVAMLTPAAAVGGLVHIGMHAFSKITLFFGAGAIFVASHKTLVSEMDGLARKMPITMTAFAIGSLSMIGLPPAAGLVSKVYLVQGAGQAGYHVILGVLLVSALLNAGYYLPILWRAFFRPPAESDPFEGTSEAPWPCVVALAGTALATTLLFFWPDVFVDLATSVARAGGLL